MSHTDGRDFVPEYVVRIDAVGATVEISKLGGGTLGRSYAGLWEWTARLDSGEMIHSWDADWDMLNTGTPKTHRQAAFIVADFLSYR